MQLIFTNVTAWRLDAIGLFMRVLGVVTRIGQIAIENHLDLAKESAGLHVAICGIAATGVQGDWLLLYILTLETILKQIQ